MTMDEKFALVKKDELPKPTPAPRSPKRALRQEITLQGIEMAAIAYVRMKHGDYKFGAGTYKNKESRGNINKSELMRLAGYSRGSWEMFDDYLAEKPEFWRLVELHEIRYTDPHFRKDYENQLWSDVGGEAMRNLYERVFYTPHSMPTAELIKIVQLILQAGITMNKLGEKKDSRTDKLMEKLSPDQRARVVKERKAKLEKELKEVERLELAHEAADAEDEDAD